MSVVGITLTADGSGTVTVLRHARPIGRVWWNAFRETYIAETVSGSLIGDHPLRVTAISMVTQHKEVPR